MSLKSSGIFFFPLFETIEASEAALEVVEGGLGLVSSMEVPLLILVSIYHIISSVLI